VAITVLKLIVCQVLYEDCSPNDSGISRAVIGEHLTGE
jgi:hypothetical protein